MVMNMDMQCSNNYQIYVESGKHAPGPSVNVSCIDATSDAIMTRESGKGTEIQLSLSTKELIDGQNTGISCKHILKLINDGNVLI